MALTPQQELQIRERLERVKDPNEELSLRESLEKGSPLEKPTVLGVAKRVGKAASRAQFAGQFDPLEAIKGIPRGLGRFGHSALQIGAELLPSLTRFQPIPSTTKRFIRDEFAPGFAQTVAEREKMAQDKFREGLPQDPIDARSQQVGAAVGEIAPSVYLLSRLRGGAGVAPALAGRAGFARQLATNTAAAAGLSAGSFREPGESRLEKAKSGAKFGFGATLGAKGVQIAAKNLGSPIKAALSPLAKRAAKTKEFAKSQKVMTATGGKLTLGEATGSPNLINIEEGARRSFVGAGKNLIRTNNQLKAAEKAFTNTMRKFSPNTVNAEQVGLRVQKAFDDTLDAAVTMRSVNGKRLFGEFAKVTGQKKIIQTNNLRKVLVEIERDQGPFAKLLVGKQPTAILKTIAKSGKRFNGKEVVSTLSFLSKVQRGRASIFKDLDRAQQKLFAGRLIDAIQKDVKLTSDAFAKAGNPSISNTLNRARQQWKLDSNAINNLENSSLTKIIGSGVKTPGQMAESLTKLPPSAVRASMKMIEGKDPKLSGQVKRLFLQNILEKGQVIKGKSVSQSTLDPFEVIARLAPNKHQKKIVLSLFDPKERIEVNNIIHLYRGLSSSTLHGGQQQAGSLVVEGLGNAFSGNPIFLSRLAGKIFGPAGMSKHLLTQDGIKALIVFNHGITGRVPMASKEFIAAAQLLRNNVEQKKQRKNGN